ncbi:MAG TPA: hypothetical protein VHG28_07095 [Longimicrobiaceae bacterium]|nr:hypothetical protein [Longimicrobiaceae bacterium]
MRVEADLFSGRPNPAWTLDEAESATFARLFAGLVRTAAPPWLEDGLGYRGLRVTGTDGGIGECEEVRVLRGHVAARCTDGERSYLDTERALERWLVGSARGRVDAQVLQMLRAEVEV